MPGTAVRPIVDEFDIAAPGANTDILAADIATGDVNGSLLRVGVALQNASVFNVAETRGGVTRVFGLNASVALNAGDFYAFALPISDGSTYNFQVETDGIIRKLLIQEVKGGVV